MSKKPNILFIFSDQHRYDCVGNSKAYPVSTPNIDKLASEGIWFTRAYTPIPLCCPARQCLLNGRRPESFGAHWNYDITLKIPALEPDEYSWPRELKDQGYRTGYVGKWHVNPEYDPTAYGFDHYIGNYNAFLREKYPNIQYTNRWFGEKDPVPLEDSRTHWQADKAIGLIKKYTGENTPWLIRLDFTEPHLPCRPAGQFADMYNPKNVPVWGSFNDEFSGKPYIQKQQLYNWGIENYTWEDWAPIVARYYGIISQMDDAIGKVLNILDELNITRETIVIYSTDHGDMCGGHRMIDKHYVMYEDIVRVPLVIRWPEGIKAGMICDEFVSNCLDIPPTILEMVGLKPRDFFHGRSLLPLIREESVPDWPQEIVSTYNGQQFGLYTQRMIRDKKWKYIWNTTDVDELYNMEEDPDELVNVIYHEEHADIVARFREKLYYELRRTGDGLVKSEWMKHQLLDGKKI